jgi:hypothetical protein
MTVKFNFLVYELYMIVFWGLGIGDWAQSPNPNPHPQIEK